LLTTPINNTGLRLIPKGIVYLSNRQTYGLVLKRQNKNKTEKLMACVDTKIRGFSAPYYS